MKYLITGGAGFIGSHIADYLLRNKHQVTVYDNFSTGKEFFIKHHLDNPKLKLIRGDLAEKDKLEKALKGAGFVFHTAAHADVKSGYEDHQIDHSGNLEMTRNVLEAMYKNRIKNIAFTSTSSVYGDAKVHPTPEDYPTNPTSLYGATKAACESYINAYASYYGMRTYVFRLTSFLGERYQHGIVLDVLKKLKSNSRRIELLSDGTPKKSSLYVGDGITAMFKVINNSVNQFNTLNVGHTEVLTVKEIVDIITESAGFKHVNKIWMGKSTNWKGDNEFVLLSIKKLKRLGWKPRVRIAKAIELTVSYLMKNKELTD